MTVRWRRPRRPPPGVNVVGYFDATGGLADRAHELVACLREAGVAVGEWSVAAPGGPIRSPRPDTVYDTTIAVVTAVQLATAREQVPDPFERNARTVGYFFWELASVPDEQQWGIGLVDEIWTPTGFVHDAYESATDRTVRVVPLPIAAPTPSGRDRASFGFGDEVVFLTSFDFLSSMRRKNPVGAIDAFRRAFPDDATAARLVIKSINADARPDDRAIVLAAMADDDRIELWDEHLDREDLAALIAAADVFVSLHRSEGLGLHLAEAMWLGTPVIATNYSGSTDVTGDAVALVDAATVPVSADDEAYSAGEWADPDPDVAASLLRHLADDPEARADLAHRGRNRMMTLDDRTAAGARLRSLLDQE